MTLVEVEALPASLMPDRAVHFGSSVHHMQVFTRFTCSHWMEISRRAQMEGFEWPTFKLCHERAYIGVQLCDCQPLTATQASEVLPHEYQPQAKGLMSGVDCGVFWPLAAGRSYQNIQPSAESITGPFWGPMGAKKGQVCLVCRMAPIFESTSHS